MEKQWKQRQTLFSCDPKSLQMLTAAMKLKDALSLEGFPCGSADKEFSCSVGDLGSIPGLGRSPGEGNGYPLQYSGRENSMDCIVHGVAKSRTWLSHLHFTSLYPWKKSYDQPRQYIKKQRHYFANNGLSSQSYGFSSNHEWMWELECQSVYWCFWTVMLGKTLESPLDYKEIKPVNPKGNQSWIFMGKTDPEAETPILWLPDAKNWLLG